jgi:integrase
VPRSWSEAQKACRQHPKGVRGRSCSCRVGWRYRMGLPDPVTGLTGKPKWSRTFPTKEAADGDQRAVRTAIAEGTFTSDRGKTVEEYLTEWITRKEAAGRKRTTVVGYRSIIDNHLVPKLGRHRLGGLRPDHVQAMIDELGNERSMRSSKPIAPGTLRNIRACLRVALAEAVRKQLVPRNVATMVEMPSVNRPKPIRVEDDPLTRFITHVADDPLSALWDVDATYGMRRAELLGLRWPDIESGRHLIRIRQTLLELKGDYECPFCGQVHHRLLFDPPKSSAGERVYPLVPEIEASLLAHRLRQEDERRLYGNDYADHDLVFARPDGQPWRPSWISSEFKRHMVGAGIVAEGEKVPPMKTLRSTAVTALHEAGAELEVISKVTGHAGTEVTKEHYLAITAENTRTEFQLIAGRLLGGRSDRLSDHRAETASPVRIDSKEGQS